MGLPGDPSAIQLLHLKLREDYGRGKREDYDLSSYRFLVQ